MSKTITMSFFPSQGNTVKAFASMVRRLVSEAKVGKIQRHERSWNDDPKQLDFDTLMSIIEAPESETLADSEDSFSYSITFVTANFNL